MLAGALGSPDALARAHVLAWLWNDAADVRAAARHDLVDLAPASVADAAALEMLRDLGPAAEVLRAAAELELPLLAALEPIPIDVAAWGPALAEVAPAAPELNRLQLALARALPRRGRVYNARIMVGVPGVAGGELAHLCWQAAHEATVAEVERSRAVPSATLERTAIGLLRSRAGRAGLEDAHGRWLATLDLASLGAIPDVDDATE